MQVKRVSLELGGKAPFVVFDDADVEAAARAAIFGMFRNAGQACGATTRLLLYEGIHDRFLSRVLELTSQIDVGHPADQFTDMGPLISSSQEKIVLDYIKLGQDAGFELVTGGEKLTGGEYDHGYYVEPTIFDRVDNSSSLSQEEIFGPVVTVTTFQEEDEAIELANAVDFGLVAGVWSTDYPRALRVASTTAALTLTGYFRSQISLSFIQSRDVGRSWTLGFQDFPTLQETNCGCSTRRVRAGTVWIWDNYAQPVEGIWGCFKQSGIGRELGYHGLDDFLEVTQIFTDGTGLAAKPACGQLIKEGWLISKLPGLGKLLPAGIWPRSGDGAEAGSP